MNICYVLPTLEITGGVNVIIEHTLQLKKRGHEVLFVHTGEGTELNWREDCDVPIVSLKRPGSMGFYAAFAPDILFATGWQTAFEIVSRKLSAKRYCYFVQDKESGFYPPNTLEHELADFTLTLPFNYLSEAKWICEWLKRDFGHRVAYAPNAINQKFIHPAEPYLQKGKRLRILLEGPLCLERKRMKDAFLAVEGIDAEIWCVSSAGELEPWMKPDIFLNRVPFSRMKHIYSACDILVKLSSQEGFFGPPLEMMTCGGTAVTSNVTGHDEYMEDGVNGFVVPVGDYKAANKALQRLVSEPELLKKLRQGAKTTAARFTWDRTGDLVEKWLLEVMKAPDAGQPNPCALTTPIAQGIKVAGRSYFEVVKRSPVATPRAPESLYAGALPVQVEAAGTKAPVLSIQGWAFSPAAGCMDTKWQVDVAGHPGRVLSVRRMDRADVRDAVPAVTARDTGFVITALCDDWFEDNRSPSAKDVTVKDKRGRKVDFQSIERLTTLRPVSLTVPENPIFAELGFKLLFVLDAASAADMSVIYYDAALEMHRRLGLSEVASHTEQVLLECDDLGILHAYLDGARKFDLHVPASAVIRDVRVAAGF